MLKQSIRTNFIVDPKNQKLICQSLKKSFSVSTKTSSDDSSSSSSSSKKPDSQILTKQTIKALKNQAIANANANYKSLPPLTSNFDKLSIKNPKSFLKPRIHLTSFPKIGLKITRPAKETDSYGINFGITSRPTNSTTTSTSKPSSNESTTTDKGVDDQKLSLVDKAIIERTQKKLLEGSKQVEIESDDPTRFKHSFGSINDDPTRHKASSQILPISHKKLRKLSHLINQHRLTLDQAILQMRFSHKAISSKILDLLLKAKNDAIKRGFNSNRLMIEQTWVTKGFQTSQLQVRARGRHGRMTHPTSKFNLILKQSSDLKDLNMIKRLELLKKSKKNLKQRGCINGSPIRLPGDGILPTSVEQRVNWAW